MSSHFSPRQNFESTASRNDNMPKMSVLAQFDDFCRRVATDDDEVLYAMLDFVRNQEVCRQRWEAAEKCCNRLAEDNESLVLMNSELQAKLRYTRDVLEKEVQRRLKCEAHLRALQAQLDQIRYCVFGQGFQNREHHMVTVLKNVLSQDNFEREMIQSPKLFLPKLSLLELSLLDQPHRDRYQWHQTLLELSIPELSTLVPLFLDLLPLDHPGHYNQYQVLQKLFLLVQPLLELSRPDLSLLDWPCMGLYRRRRYLLDLSRLKLSHLAVFPRKLPPLLCMSLLQHVPSSWSHLLLYTPFLLDKFFPALYLRDQSLPKLPLPLGMSVPRLLCMPTLSMRDPSIPNLSALELLLLVLQTRFLFHGYLAGLLPLGQIVAVLSPLGLLDLPVPNVLLLLLLLLLLLSKVLLDSVLLLPRFTLRCRVVERMLIAVDRPAASLPLRVSLYSALEMVKASWAEVTATCVQNCFRKAGFADVGADADPEASEEDHSGGDLWQRVVDSDMGGRDICWDDFVMADDDTDTAEPCMDEGIVNEVRGKSGSEESDDDDDETLEPAPTSVPVATGYIDSLRQLVYAKGLGEEHAAALNKLETTLIASALSKQTSSLDESGVEEECGFVSRLERMGPLNRSTPLPEASQQQQQSHTFVSRPAVNPENCIACNKRIRFYKASYQCGACGVVCHPECKSLVPLPCGLRAPPREARGASGGAAARSGAGVLADYAPSEPPFVTPLVVHCIREVERRCLQERGPLYGSVAPPEEVDTLLGRLLSGHDLPILSDHSLPVVCGALMKFLATLRETVITKAVWPLLAEAAVTGDEDKENRVWKFLDATCQLPAANRAVLSMLLVHLRCVSTTSLGGDGRSLDELAAVFAPVVVGCSTSSPSAEVQERDRPLQDLIMHCLLGVPDVYWKDNAAAGSYEPVQQETRPGTSAEDCCVSRWKEVVKRKLK
ncbi:hypothetical protein HPB52_004789 [Rhipicephalus sanguineus]|uniref:Uncharacterized protein n=1 Tax=Rhipicephalus sanguineus TaxID=34632 RepID=A0A9D4PBW2_RHISA|nr:hypothetical protein HPB52_004789 [Rhipicephalus sanguineus]